MAEATKTVSLDGVQYVVPADASLDEIDQFIQSKGSPAPAHDMAMTKEAPRGDLFSVPTSMEDVSKNIRGYLQTAKETAPNPLTALAEMGKKGALPTAGQMVGRAVGGPIGGAVGSMGGEGLNQLIGIT